MENSKLLNPVLNPLGGLLPSLNKAMKNDKNPYISTKTKISLRELDQARRGSLQPNSESRRGSLIPSGSTSPRRGSLLPGAPSSRRGSSELSSEDFDSDKFWSEQQKDEMPGGSTRSRRGSNVSLYGDVYAMKQDNLEVPIPKIDDKSIYISKGSFRNVE